MAEQRFATLLTALRDKMRAANTLDEAQQFTLPAAIYTDPDRLAVERASLFRRLPMILGHESMLPNPGDVWAGERENLPLLLTRDRAGQIHGLVNICRHRGTRLVKAAGLSQRPTLTCPYHHWVFGLDGDLKHLPCADAFPDLDQRAHALQRIPLTVRHGLIWGILDPGATDLDLDHHLAGLGGDFTAFALDSHHHFRRQETTRACNWKLVMDAFLEAYHVKRLHSRTVGPYFLDGYAAMDRFGRHIRAAVARTEATEALALDPADWDTRRHVTFTYSLFPSSVMIFHPDYVSVMTLFPEGPDRTRFVHDLLTPAAVTDDKARDHYERSFELIDGGVFQSEDLWVCEEIQASLSSRAARDPIFGKLESSVGDFHRNIDAAISEAGDDIESLGGLTGCD